MPDYDFYLVGCAEPRGLRRAVVPVRRGLRRILRPMFLRLAEILRHLAERQDALTHRVDAQAHQIDRLVAYQWDHGAVVHRLAVLEEQVETLLRRVPEARSAVPEVGPIPAGRHWLVDPDHGPATQKAPCRREESARRVCAARHEDVR